MWNSYNSVGFSTYGGQQQMGQQMQQGTMLRGRMVTSLDEVRACPVIMDGADTYFPVPAENAIYAKYVDLNGNPVIRKYIQVQDNKQGTQSVDLLISDLQNRVKSLEKVLEDLNTPTTAKKGGVKQ